jgi:regulatory protein YycI of two-component signal transduction system YycFG
MKFITNLFKNKIIFYLAFVLLVIFISYSLFNKYKETYSRNRNRIGNRNKKNNKKQRSKPNNKRIACNKFIKPNDCVKRLQNCMWYKNTGQCLNKKKCSIPINKCKNNFYCNWNDSTNACEFKPMTK